MKKIIGISSLSVLIISSQLSYANNLKTPTSINEFLYACQIASRNKLFSIGDAYQAAYCMGTLSGYISAKVRYWSGSPGFSIKGFVRKATDIDRQKSRTVRHWDVAAPHVLIEEVLKKSGAKPCNNSPELLCVDQNVLFE